ncbi:MAG: hypothetical protein M1450_02640 [Patescibacteria group bacterium]|nr:hypothetical protein [Patescibacteria group bacterium]
MIKNKIKLLLTVLILTFLFSFSARNQIFAEEKTSFLLSPPTTSLTVMPGQKGTTSIKVINQSVEPIFFEAQVQDFIVEGINGSPSLVTNNSQKFSAQSWISISPKNFTIGKQQNLILNLDIYVPKNAEPGGHYAAILIKPKNNSAYEGARVETRLGSLLYLSVSGNIIENLKAEILSQKFYEYGPIDATLKIKNLGNLHTMPFGKITISDIFGRVVEVKEIPANNIFPESERDFKELLGTKLMIGRYKVSFEGNYGEGKKVSAQTYFWVIPWRIISSLLVLILLVLIILLLRRRKIL